MNETKRKFKKRKERNKIKEEKEKKRKGKKNKKLKKQEEKRVGVETRACATPIIFVRINALPPCQVAD